MKGREGERGGERGNGNKGHMYITNNKLQHHSRKLQLRACGTYRTGCVSSNDIHVLHTSNHVHILRMRTRITFQGLLFTTT